MNIMQRAERAYGNPNAPIKSDTQIEYETIARISRRLNEADLNKKSDYPSFVAALNDNRSLWRTLAVDVADRENSLSTELRAQVFYLAEFTDQHTAKVLRGGAEIDILKDINLAVMRGLNSSGKPL